MHKYNILIKHLIIIPRNKDQMSVRHVQFVTMYISFPKNLTSVNAMQFYVIKHLQTNFSRILKTWKIDDGVEKVSHIN